MDEKEVTKQAALLQAVLNAKEHGELQAKIEILTSLIGGK